MRIVHIDLTGPFTEGMNYQENLLAGINAEDGHEVYFIATDYIWIDNKMKTVSEKRFSTHDGVTVIRKSYINLGLSIMTNKLRAVDGMKKLLEELMPDVIMLHGYQTLAVLPIIKYLKQNSNVRFFVDNHADLYNSAQNRLSKVLLNGIFYTWLAKKVLKYTEKIWCISYDVMKFTELINKVPGKRLEYYPLGGRVFTQEEYEQKRKKVRNRYGFTAEDLVLVHSGKMNAQKKTIDILKAMQKVKDRQIQLIIIGSMEEEVKKLYQQLAGDDKRIQYIGWKDGEELLEYLCSADVYIQPGTQSATMQNAACCRCALALYPYESHKMLFGENVFYIENSSDIADMLQEMLRDPMIIQIKREHTFDVALEQLDYKKLAARLYEQ